MQFLKTIQVLQDMGKYIRQQARSNLTKQKKNVDRTLYESITYGVHNQQKKIDLLVEMAEYGKFQDQGVRGLKASPINTMNSPYRFGNKMPPIQTIADWAKKKNIRLRDDKGKFAKGNYNTIGFLFARSIRDKGFKASMFLTRPYQLSLVRYYKPMLQALGEDVAEQIKQTAKEMESKKFKDKK